MLTGEGRRKVLLVSEKDHQSSHPYVDKLLNRAGLDRSAFYFGSLQTPDLLEDAKERGVKTVVGLGEWVLGRLTGERDVLRWRGRVQQWPGQHFISTFAPHKLLPESPNSPEVLRLRATGIAPYLNPPRFQGTFMLDIQKALWVAQNGFTRVRPNYIVDPDPHEFSQWADAYFAHEKVNPDVYLSWDIETPYKQKTKDEENFEEANYDTTILRVSFAYEEYTGVSVPWSPPYFNTIERLISSAANTVVWNGTTFDVPVVESVGVRVGGVVHDYMDGWHIYQSDLPKGLEFVTSFTSDLLPWKHLNNSEPGLYSAIDADAALRNAYWTRNRLKQTGQWGTFINHVVKLMPVMRTAGKRGNFIDIPWRDALRKEASELLAEKVGEVQAFVPRAVKPRKVWLNPPVEGWEKFHDPRLPAGADVLALEHEGRDFDRVSVTEDIKVCSACEAIATNKTEHFTGSKVPKLDADGNQVTDKKTLKPKFTQVKNPCKVAGGEIVIRKGIRYEYHEVEDFNPNSSQQLMTYARYHGHPVGENKKDSSKEAFDASHIKQLVKDYGVKHPIYAHTLEIHKLSKMLGTYIYDPDADGLIHTTYKNAPSTPRFSSANVNLQNVGKREDNPWATKARKQIVARPGYRFVQSDSSAIEALIQGYFMGDEMYMKLATQSVHAWVVAMEIGLEWTGTEEQVSWLKKHHHGLYDKMKTTNYLTNFGGGDYLMWKSFPDVFPTRADAKAAQDKLYARLPKLKEFHYWVRVKANKEGYLKLPGWGHRHYYYDVFNGRDRNGDPRFGKDAKKVCAWFPQGCAASFMRDNLLLMAYGDEAAEWLGIEPLGLTQGWLDSMPANVVVHDGYTLEVLDGLEKQAQHDIELILTRPIHQLNGLRVGCETDISAVGGNWAPFDEVKNPLGLRTVNTVRMDPVLPPSDLRMAA